MLSETMWVRVPRRSPSAESLHALVDALWGERLIRSRMQQHSILEIRLSAIAFGFERE
jgi:hypothetical protein